MESVNEEEIQKKKLKTIRTIIQIVVMVLIIGIAIYASIRLYPLFMKIQNDEGYRNTVVTKLKSFGSYSWIILILAQILQTVLAVIPSGPIVILTGIIYTNPFIGVLISLVGQTLGALLVIGLVKVFGYSFLALFIDPDQPKKLKLLEDGKRCGVLMFSYLLIPVLPKDPIAFIVPFTKVKVRHFIWINLVARTPMTIVSVIFGNSLISGNMTAGIIIASISAFLAVLCFIFNKQIVSFIDRITSKKNDESIE